MCAKFEKVSLNIRQMEMTIDFNTTLGVIFTKLTRQCYLDSIMTQMLKYVVTHIICLNKNLKKNI